MPVSQTYASHRRFHPLYHFFTFPVLAINFVWQFIIALRHATVLVAWWNALVACALMVAALLIRVYALRNQDRIIGVEETLRLTRLLPDDLKGRIPELRSGQLIALRFCADEQLPQLTREVLAGEVATRDEIKKRITHWREDSRRI